ncbi:hypothetical protein [Spirosoma litoris]
MDSNEECEKKLTECEEALDELAKGLLGPFLKTIGLNDIGNINAFTDEQYENLGKNISENLKRILKKK